MTNDHQARWPRLKVRQIMAANPVTIQADSSLAQVAETLVDCDIGGLPVVDAGGAVIGVISQADIVRLRGRSMPPSSWRRVLVRDVMTHPPITVAASASLQEAAQLMAEHRVHRLVVVAERDGSPIGLISQSDVVREVAALTGEG